MIFFCEDCGEKNILVPEQLDDGKAVFRCTSCSYMNTYRTETERQSNSDTPEAFLNDIQALPEIIGSFLFHREKGVVKNNMPGILKAKNLDILGKILIKNFSDCRFLYPDVNEMALIISDRNLLVKMIDSNLALIIAGKRFPLSETIMDRLGRLALNHPVHDGK